MAVMGQKRRARRSLSFKHRPFLVNLLLRWRRGAWLTLPFRLGTPLLTNEPPPREVLRLDSFPERKRRGDTQGLHQGVLLRDWSKLPSSPSHDFKTLRLLTRRPGFSGLVLNPSEQNP